MQLKPEGAYDNIDFDMPGEDESLRYTFVEQSFIEIGQNTDSNRHSQQKLTHVLPILEQIAAAEGKVLILVRKKSEVDNIAKYISDDAHIICEKTHGDIGQPIREQTIFSFKHGHIKVLVSTMKLLGRGVKIDGVSNMIFWDPPDTLEEYMFCLGRVGCVGHKAKSTAFFESFEGIVDGKMVVFLRKNQQTLPKDMVSSESPPTEGNVWGYGAR